MRSIALALATFLVFTVAAVAPARAQEVEIEEEPAEGGGDLSDLGARPKGPQAPAVRYGAEGFYAIAAGTYGVEDLKNTKKDIEGQLGGKSELENALGFNLRIGDRWHPNLATELEWEWIDAFGLYKPNTVGGGVGEIWSLTVNQKAFLSTGRFQLFILAGLGVGGAAEAEAAGVDQGGAQGTGLGVRAGAGFNYYINEHFGLNTDMTYNWGTGSVNDLRYSSFSWGIIFNP